ncbi:OLC1v1025615C1 [Oldenlandia corymbosa var. corymbosa]|uniref:OLC1v1025615C1 n=1 Tax=Oldenlandia corymbosa var. corymbosa TaxID=529605 RepID=A0AAV1C897_OLDCO|nr:OLC1v1025615C1 [Oldenlandia corymbosa var. corymbosa]
MASEPSKLDPSAGGFSGAPSDYDEARTVVVSILAKDLPRCSAPDELPASEGAGKRPCSQIIFPEKGIYTVQNVIDINSHIIATICGVKSLLKDLQKKCRLYEVEKLKTISVVKHRN